MRIAQKVNPLARSAFLLDAGVEDNFRVQTVTLR